MKKQDKQLLLKDLCARLPYGVYAKFKQYNEPLCLSVKDTLAIYNGGEIINDLQYLYLRPMSSMTEKEQQEYYDLTHQEEDDVWAKCLFDKIVDFCNERHLDYRGLISIGLALEAPDGMYKNE